jgi:transcriptional regulator with XRE-family HTH domain
MFIPALAFCGFDITDSKPLSSAYPKNIESVGDHLRARRIEQELKQSDVSVILQVSEATITNWENNLTKPETRYIPAIIRFLGYNPNTADTNSLGGRIKYYRQTNGLTHKKMGKIFGVNASTIGSWENNEHVPNRRLLKQIDEKITIVTQE